MSKAVLLAFALLISIGTGSALAQQRKVMFPSKDGLILSADLYEFNPDYPWIVLCHQARSSRGEFKDIALRLGKLEYNCLAVDLRSGSESNFIMNESSALAIRNGLPTGYLDAEKDIITAINNAYRIGRKKVVLLGSSFSASLALKLANENDNVMAVVAFSPGEYFGEKYSVKDSIAGLSKPMFVLCTASERSYVDELLSKTSASRRIVFSPAEKGVHGAKALFKDSDGSTDAWIQLINFLRKVRNEKFR